MNSNQIHLTLKRITQSDDTIWGLFIDNKLNKPICLSIERIWRDNRPFESCIPNGDYKVVEYTSPRFYNVFQLMRVLDRTYILIHSANYSCELSGCIAPGESYSEKGLLASRMAMISLETFFKENYNLDSEYVKHINLRITSDFPLEVKTK